MVHGLKDKLVSVEGYYSSRKEGDFFGTFSEVLNSKRDFRPIEVSTDDSIVMIYTAAVTGRPRGALLSHGNILSFITQFILRLNNESNDHLKVVPRNIIYLSVLPLFHVGGLLYALTVFYAGGLNIIINKFDVEQAVNLIQEKKINMLSVFPPILASILDQQEKTGADITSLKIVAGLDTSENIIRYQKVTGGDFYSGYGQTEVPLVTFGRFNTKPGSAGYPLPLTEVRFVDHYDREVPDGQIGEVVVRSSMVFKGYWNLPEETTHTFRSDWHHTGDMGYFDEDGFVWYVGRKAEKELIKPGGENVYPAEVEKVILEHPAIAKTVVFGIPDHKWGEAIKAVCQLKEGEKLEVQELIDFLTNRIARYKKPHYIVFVKELPLCEDGSPDRAKVKDQYGA